MPEQAALLGKAGLRLSLTLLQSHERPQFVLEEEIEYHYTTPWDDVDLHPWAAMSLFPLCDTALSSRYSL